MRVRDISIKQHNDHRRRGVTEDVLVMSGRVEGIGGRGHAVLCAACTDIPVVHARVDSKTGAGATIGGVEVRDR